MNCWIRSFCQIIFSLTILWGEVLYRKIGGEEDDEGQKEDEQDSVEGNVKIVGFRLLDVMFENVTVLELLKKLC